MRDTIYGGGTHLGISAFWFPCGKARAERIARRHDLLGTMTGLLPRRGHMTGPNAKGVTLANCHGRYEFRSSSKDALTAIVGD